MATPAARATILIVEDNTDQRQTLAEILVHAGYRADCAANGQEALDRLQQPHLPGLILLDLMMPVMGGSQFLERQREDPFLTHIPVVVVSARPNDLAFAASLGTAGQLSKPINIPDLLKLVNRFCG